MGDGVAHEHDSPQCAAVFSLALKRHGVIFGRLIARGVQGRRAVNRESRYIVQIYLVRGFINSLPKALDESAEIDGCGFFGTFVHIIFPMLKPIIATIGILSFQGSWNEYMMPTLFTLTRPEQRTLIVGVMALKSSGEAASSWNLMLAGTTVALIPVLVAYAIGNKYFVKGIASGSVKG